MSIKKLSLAAAISIGLLTTGISASMAQTCPIPKADPICKPLRTATPICKPCVPCGPSSYGAGAAGTFKAYGTTDPWGGNTAGVTEISSFKSPVNQPTGAAASMAANGVYGSCISSSQTATTGGAAALYPLGTSTVTIQKQLTTPNSTASVATPTVSKFTGGAAAAEQQGMKCVEVPTKIPVAIAAPACAASACVPCPKPVDPCAKQCQANTNAPSGFAQPANPGSIASAKQEYITGAAAPVYTKNHWWQFRKNIQQPTGGAGCIPCQPVNPCPQVIQCPATEELSINPLLSEAACPTGYATPVVQPQCQEVCPTIQPQFQPCPTGLAAPCPTICPNPLSTSGALIVQPRFAIPTQPWQITGGAASLPCQANANLTKTSENVQYIERQAYTYPAMTGATNVAVNTAPNQIAYGGGGVVANNPITASGIAYGGNIPGYNQSYMLGAAAPLSYNNNIIGYNQSYFLGGAAPIGNNLSSGAPVFSFNGSTCGAAAPVASSISGCATPITLSPGATISRIDKMSLNTPISIQSQSGMKLQRYALVPGTQISGAAAPIISQFSDVPSDFWASKDINKLASAGIISGYPDRTFKPNFSVSRAEFASMLVSGLNLQTTSIQNRQIFRDVPSSHWAAGAIDRAYSKGLIAGYPNSTFMPSMSISRAEALTTLAKSLCNIPQLSEQEACQLLSQYCDSNQVPNWARISVARALKAGLLENSQRPNMINPCSNASRADVASMLSNTRISLALEPKVAQCPTGAAATVVQQSVTIPTLSIKFKHEVSARSGHVGDKFAANTLEAVTINGCCYPTGSIVRGKIVEVLRPGNHQNGALKLAFTDITAPDGQRSALPKDVITAQIQLDKNKNVISRIVEFPIVLPSRMIGITGRTLGGMTVIAGNGIEQTLSQGGVALGQLVTGQFIPAGRSTINSAIALGKMPVDMATTAFSGGAGLFNVTTDEIGFLVGPDGKKIARVLPKDNVSIAFGCLE
ncbi:MAG: S-layer homology domain-containing protein [Candidatus Gastranaerophilales bacterium]|nr:S-layer homology domain-containing protein [Candidatus Gastranaerophilales bacterium]